MSEDKPLTIGEVISLLRDEFPDVSVSKLRFLESQGLLDPDRSKSGYRQFTDTDLRRLRFILQQQRDHFLPLKVIKSKLTLWERGEELGPEPGPSLAVGSDDVGEPLSRSDLLKRSGLEDDQLDDLLEHGVLKMLDDSTVFPPEAGVVASEARRLLEHGLEARHLRAIRLAAEREAELLLRLAMPLIRTDVEARNRATEVLEATADAVQAMHRALLVAELRANT